MTKEGYSPGFLYEAELSFSNPLTIKVTTDWGWSTADYFDVNCASLIMEVRQQRSDAILIEGENGDDLVVVFEPHQINLVHVFEGDILVYHRDSPADTRYPEILGPDAHDPNVNVGVYPFHYEETEDPNYRPASANSFGKLLDSEAKKVLSWADTYSPGDGRHFGRGEEFTKLAFALFCDGKLSDGHLTRCRQDCLIAHDFGTGLTLIYDLRQSGDTIQALGRRPMVDVPGAATFFHVEDGSRPSRALSQLTGPDAAIQNILRQLPEYEHPFTLITHSHHAESFRFDGDGRLQIPGAEHPNQSRGGLEAEVAQGIRLR